jgi:two-component system cell cycle sensor histidine kinase/response regulator CckA
MCSAVGPGSGTILNVDDDLLGRFAITYLLRQTGFQVHEAGTAAEALRLAADKPDLVLLDVHLPDGNGLDICRRLKEDPATAEIPVIFLSAVAVSSEDRIRGLALGADDYLVKPIEPAVVVAHVKAILRIRQAERRAHAAQVQAAEARSRLADAEQALARDALLLSHVRDPLIVTDLQGVVAYWNEGGTRLFGWQASEMLGRPLVERLPEHEQAAFRAILQSVAAGNDWEGEFEDYRKDGSRVWVEVHAGRIPGAVRGQDGILWLAHDVTRRKRLEEQHRQAQKLEVVGRLAGGLAHDFNDLLTVITGYGDVLLSSLSRVDPLRAMVGEMTKAGERAAALAHRLLTFSRRGRVPPRVLDLNAVVTDLASLLRWALGEDVELRPRLQPDLGRVRADPGEIDQVVVGLAVQVRDMLSPGGKLTIETRNVDLDEVHARSQPGARAGPHVLLAVGGIGQTLTEEIKARLFAPLVAPREPGQGAALGLAAIHDAVRKAGGHLGVRSEPGRGTTFEVYLPRAVEAVPRGMPLPNQTVGAEGPRTVLVVEDEESVRALVCLVLGRRGYTVLEAGHVEEACRAAERHGGPIHLLLTDVVLSGGGGRQLAADLLARHPEMKVLCMSGYSECAVAGKGVLAAVPFLPKPFSPAALADKVREVLDAQPERSGA